jgi:opacity protein-like surface antigen
MKSIILATVSALALTGAAQAADMPVLKAPAIEATAPVSGYIELYSGWGNQDWRGDFQSYGFDGWTLGGAARATYFWAPGASLQLDVQGEGTNYSFDGGRFSEHSYLIGAHASWRNSQYLWGVFGAAGDSTGIALVSDTSFRHGIVGGEAQAYLGPITLYGQVGYDTTLGNPLDGSLERISAVFGRGTVRYYLGPNTRLEGTGVYASGKVDFNCCISDVDFETWLVRAKVEHKFAGSPFSLFAAYEWSQYKFTDANFFDGARITDQKFTAGVRLGINEGTLQANDRRGTTLDIIDFSKMFIVPFGKS